MKIEKYYKREAQEFIDMLFDKGYFGQETTRKDMRQVEKLLGFILQSKVNMAVKGTELLRKLRK